jgi:hypothetical protein
MSKTYMTASENEARKSKMRNESYDCRPIKDVFPLIKLIEINYTTTHRSAFGVNYKEDKSTYSSNNISTFLIDCPNEECTKGFFDLKSEIQNMYLLNMTENSKTIY